MVSKQPKERDLLQYFDTEKERNEAVRGFPEGTYKEITKLEEWELAIKPGGYKKNGKENYKWSRVCYN